MRRLLFVTMTCLLLACGAPPEADEPPPRDEAGGTAEPEEEGAGDATPTAEPSEDVAPASPRDAAASAMEALLAACGDDDLATAAGYIAYRGPDESRRWRDAPRMDAPDEARQVAGICQRVAALVRGSSAHEKVSYESEAESEGVWHVWHVRFDTTQGPVTQIFAFLEVDGRFLLGDID